MASRMQHATSDEVTIAIVDDHDAIHAGLELWCSESERPTRVVITDQSIDRVLTAGARAVDLVVLGPRAQQSTP